MPYTWNQPTYGANVQYADKPDVSPLLDTKAATLVQQIAGTFLYYAMAGGSTMLAALHSIAATQAKKPPGGTWSSTSTAPAATYPRPKPEGVLMATSSSAISLLRRPTKQPTKTPTPNDLIYYFSRIIRHIVASATKT